MHGTKAGNPPQRRAVLPGSPPPPVQAPTPARKPAVQPELWVCERVGVLAAGGGEARRGGRCLWTMYRGLDEAAAAAFCRSCFAFALFNSIGLIAVLQSKPVP